MLARLVRTGRRCGCIPALARSLRMGVPRLLNSLSCASHVHGPSLSQPTRPCMRWCRLISTTPVWRSTDRSPETVLDADTKEGSAVPAEEKEWDDDDERNNTPKAPDDMETVIGTSAQHAFMAETQQLLKIVTHSIYTEREVFLRELISNSSDALEKVRHLQLTGQNVSDPEKPLEIHIWVEEKSGKISIQDTGIGMSEEEMIKNLGTIAHSGTKAFLQRMEDAQAQHITPTSIIGQFGVGFYSVFMVADQVRVFSKSANVDAPAHCWSSEGVGNFQVSPAEGVVRGTKVIVSLRKDSEEFASRTMLEKIVKKYSNFVGFPIFVNGQRVNTIEAIWTMPRATVTEDMHKHFYRFIAHAYDDPFYSLQFTTDVPLSIKSIFYVPERHAEKYGMGRMDMGVGLYSRKILIETKCKNILPSWLRFVKGVVDSEDLPVNISREHYQDSMLMRRLNNVLTKRLLRYLDEEGRKDPVKFQKFFKEYGHFLKEGICTDVMFKEDLGRLLRYESSHSDEGVVVSFDEYISRMPIEQKGIYYLCIPNRSLGLASPYYEVFKEKGVEVLFLYSDMDGLVMQNLGEFNKRKLITIESGGVDLEAPSPTMDERLSEEETNEFNEWLKGVLATKVSSVKATTRLVGSPCVVVDHESSSMRRMMALVDTSKTLALPKQQLEINPAHPIIRKLYNIRHAHPDIARDVAEQIFDNALIAAGLLDDSRTMLDRLNKFLDLSLQFSEKAMQPSEP